MLLAALLQAQLQGASETAAGSGVLGQLFDGHRADEKRQRLPCRQAMSRGQSQGEKQLPLVC